MPAEDRIAGDDLAVLADTTRRIVAGPDPAELVTELDDAGLVAAVCADPAVSGTLLAVQGEQLGRSTLLDVLLAGPDTARAARVVLPPPGSRQPPGRIGADGAVEVDGLVLVPERCEELLVHTSGGRVAVPARDVPLEPVRGLDPDLGAARALGAVPAAAMGSAAVPEWDAVVDLAAVAIAHELVGVGQRALDTALAHVREREQFGAPLAALQSVRHRLVGVHVELEAARAALDAAGTAPGEVDALAVKVAAGHGALGAVATAQQLCGAMGFTAEHGLHRIVRRAHLLDSLFGSADDLEIQLGALLAARGRTPAPVAVLHGGSDA